MPRPPPGPWAEVLMKIEEFRLLRDLIGTKVGLHFGPESRSTLERRLRDRLAALQLSSFAEYCHYLRFHPHAGVEWDDLMDLLTTNETYFFRETYQLRAFKEEVLPALATLARGRKRLNVWSAGCSTGEEVYTLAILVHESGLFSQSQVRIYGSDISKRCIAAARRGVYGPGAFRAIPAEIMKSYFIERDDGFHVVDRIRQHCQFGQLNLLHDERAKLLGRQDAIFCRNVLIYFDAPARKKVIDSFQERLYPGGVLFLGHSESLLNVSTAFELLHLKEDLVYRKPLLSVREPLGLESRDQQSDPDTSTRRR